MKRIDNSTATVDNLFTEGNPSTATPATVLAAQWLNVIQEELANVVEAAGLTLDQTGADDTQLLQAILGIGGALYTTTNTDNDYEVTTDPTYTSLGDGGKLIYLIFNATNDGVATLDVNSIGAESIKTKNGGDLKPGDIVEDAIYCLQWDGTDWRIQSSRSILVQGSDIAANSDTTFNVDIAAGDFYEITVTSDFTIAFTNGISGTPDAVVLEIIDGGSQTITWPAALQWAASTAPELTASGTDMILIYKDGDDTYRGSVIDLDVGAP